MNSIDILYQDDDLLLVNKPAGVLSISGGFSVGTPTVAQLLAPQFGKLWTVHRLDKDTSGVMVFARNAGAHRKLNLLFDQRKVEKSYHCLVFGHPAKQLVQLPLKINSGRSHLTKVDEQGGKPAVTDITPIGTYGLWSLVIASPHTGYTHQIRAHLAAIGCPIFMDSQYTYSSVQKEEEKDPQYSGLVSLIMRLALHCERLKFEHPTSTQMMDISCPYPADFDQALGYLKKLPAM